MTPEEEEKSKAMTPEERLDNLRKWLRITYEALSIDPFDRRGIIDDVTRWGALSSIVARAMRDEPAPNDLAAYDSIRNWRPGRR